MKLLRLNKTIIVLLLVAFISFGQLFAQKNQLELTFTAIDSASWLQMDSIKVMNRSRGGDTLLYWPDTVLVLDYSVGISSYLDIGSDFQLFQNYPNPIINETSIELNIPDEGEVYLIISDISGRICFERSDLLPKGIHSYGFKPANSGIYFLSVRYGNQSQNIKMLSKVNNIEAHCLLTYKGNRNTIIQEKETRLISDISFSLGDTLLYIGYADTMQSGILDAPLEDKTYTFQFATNIACPGIPTVEYGGQIYNTIQIFSQCWLKENLNIGEMIPGSQGMTDNDIIEKYCYNNDPAKCEVYGGLYQWDEMMDYRTIQGGKGICPQGWHIPTDEEWKVLEGAVDGFYGIGDSEWDDAWEWRGVRAGRNLKSIGSWPGFPATDLYGFRALPCGNRNPDGTFYVGGYNGAFWTSTFSTYNQNWSWTRSINHLSDQTNRQENVPKGFGLAFRCIKD